MLRIRPHIFMLIMCFAALACLPETTVAKPHEIKLEEAYRTKFSNPVLSLDVGSNPILGVVVLRGGLVRVWRFDSNETVWEKEIRSDISDTEPVRARFTPDGRSLAVSCFNRIYFFQVGTWQQVGSVGLEVEDVPEVPELRSRPDKMSTPDEGEARPKYRVTRIADFAFTPDGEYVVASYCRDQCHIMVHTGIDLFAQGSGADPVRLWHVSTGRLVWEAQYEPERVLARVIISVNGQTFATVSALHGDRLISINDVRTGDRLYSLPPFYFGANLEPDLAFLPDNHHFMTVSTDGKGFTRDLLGRLAIYDMNTGAKLRELHNRLGALHFNVAPNGRWLAAAMYRPKILSQKMGFQLWDLESGKVVEVIIPRRDSWRPWRDSPTHIRFTPDGRWLVVVQGFEGFLSVYKVVDDRQQ